MQVVPLHLDALADPAGRRAVVRRLDFDAAIEMDRPLAVPVIAKRFEWERAERRLLLGKHRRDLSLRGAVDPRVGNESHPLRQINANHRVRKTPRDSETARRRARLLAYGDQVGLSWSVLVVLCHDHEAFRRGLLRLGRVDVYGDAFELIGPDDHELAGLYRAIECVE
jgi:hypothetical protein